MRCQFRVHKKLLDKFEQVVVEHKLDRDKYFTCLAYQELYSPKQSISEINKLYPEYFPIPRSSIHVDYLNSKDKVKLNVNVEDDLHLELKEHAERHNVSLNDIGVFILAAEFAYEIKYREYRGSIDLVWRKHILDKGLDSYQRIKRDEYRNRNDTVSKFAHLNEQYFTLPDETLSSPWNRAKIQRRAKKFALDNQ